MRAEQPASDNRGFAAVVLLWLHLLILIAGALQFAFAPQAVQQPMLAVGALALLTVSILITRSIPALQRPLARQHWIDVITAMMAVTALCAATGSVRSSLLSIFAIPLARIAVAFGSWWLVVMVAIVVGALGLLLGGLTPQIYIVDPEFLTLLFNSFPPATG